MRPFRDLRAWQEGHALTRAIYEATVRYPRTEMFGLTAQTRRAAASVPGNVAEGCGKRSLAQLRASVDIASGSLSELEYWLILGRDLGYLPEEDYDRLNRQLNGARKQLIGLASWCSRRAGGR